MIESYPAFAYLEDHLKEAKAMSETVKSDQDAICEDSRSPAPNAQASTKSVLRPNYESETYKGLLAASQGEAIPLDTSSIEAVGRQLFGE